MDRAAPAPPDAAVADLRSELAKLEDDAVLEEPGEIDAALARVDAMLATLAGASRPPSP